jgi:hypothetical protein
MGDRSSEKTAQKQAVWRQGGECCQSSNGVTHARTLKNNQSQNDWECGSYVFVVVSSIKVLSDTNSYF